MRATLDTVKLTLTEALLPRVIWRDESTSTNVELRELAATASAAGADLPHGTLLLTSRQTAGRGRLDRGWEMPEDTAIAASLLVRGFGALGASAADGRGAGVRGAVGAGSGAAGAVAAEAVEPLAPSWLPLVAGAAMTRALQRYFGEGMRVGVKWPNDVHVRDEDDAMAGRPGKKLCGILCELLPDGSIIVGTGINLLLDEWQLPTERATSLLAAGANIGEAETLADDDGAALADSVLASYATELLRLVALSVTDPAAVRNATLRCSLTLGNEVRVHLPGGEIVDGRARTLAADGSLVVDLPTGGELVVSAGDVEHLR